MYPIHQPKTIKKIIKYNGLQAQVLSGKQQMEAEEFILQVLQQLKPGVWAKASMQDNGSSGLWNNQVALHCNAEKLHDPLQKIATHKGSWDTMQQSLS